ncbi:type III-B CRISPR module-associated Cmr3 family protein [Saccharopolyspora griseoalba]|uniref:Type III-B CRISPR module-associated Cmr3 family protein n=1 Tax=Saccharopolyspora griseoalba TaxID=1431848 RepID=A0ABW2LQ05_9PSEU
MTDCTRVTVTLDHEVVAGRNARADFRQDTYQHIPGSVLRGALAAVWIRERGTEITSSQSFLSAFEGDGSFGPLYSRTGYPVPLSVAVHKYAPGDDCQRRWWDRARGENATHCEQCSAPLEASKGKPQESVELIKRTMSELDAGGVAKDGQLFSQSAIAAKTRLSGWVFGDAVHGLAVGDEPIITVSLGSRRSLRGQVRLTTAEEVPEPLERRNDTDVVLRLASPAVFCDEFGFPVDTPDLTELANLLDVEVEPITDKWVRWDEAGGWHAASGLPKPTERAVAAGSTYLLRCDRAPTDDALRLLHARGIGLRRREGFGALYTAPEPVAEAACESS